MLRVVYRIPLHYRNYCLEQIVLSIRINPMENRQILFIDLYPYFTGMELLRYGLKLKRIIQLCLDRYGDVSLTEVVQKRSLGYCRLV